MAASVHSVAVRDQESGDDKGRHSRGSSFKDLDWDWTAGHQEERQHKDSKQESQEVPTQELLGVVGGEE